MQELVRNKSGLVTHVVRKGGPSVAQVAATVGVAALMAPLLFIALLPMALLALALMPPIGVWLFVGSALGGDGVL